MIGIVCGWYEGVRVLPGSQLLTVPRLVAHWAGLQGALEAARELLPGWELVSGLGLPTVLNVGLGPSYAVSTSTHAARAQMSYSDGLAGMYPPWVCPHRCRVLWGLPLPAIILLFFFFK